MTQLDAVFNRPLLLIERHRLITTASTGTLPLHLNMRLKLIIRHPR